MRLLTITHGGDGEFPTGLMNFLDIFVCFV